MQLIPNFPPPPPLEQPPLWQAWLFETPAYPAGIALGLSLAAFLVFNRLGRAKQGGYLVLAAFALSAGLWALGRWVQTDRERVMDRTRELVRSTATANLTALAPMLADDAVLLEFLDRGEVRKDRLLDQVERSLAQSYRLRSWAILDLQAVVRPSGAARTQLLVRVEAESERLVNFSWWQVDWRRSGETYVVERLKPLAIQGVKALGAN